MKRFLGAAAVALTLSAPATAATPPEQCEAIRATVLGNAETTLEALDGVRSVLIELMRMRIDIIGNEPAIQTLDTIHEELGRISDALSEQSGADAMPGYLALNELCPIHP